MSNIKIDTDLCTVCGKCTKVCGSKTLEIVNNQIVQTTPNLCCSCGHCAAICPENAISSTQTASRPFSVKKFDVLYTEIETLLASKRSVREYKSKEVDKITLEKMLYFAEKAPSSSNQRLREYVVITNTDKQLELEKAVIDKFNSLKIVANPFVMRILGLFSKSLSKTIRLAMEDIKEINHEFEKGERPIFRKAPCIVCITAPKGAVQAKDDCVIAQQYMMLYAQSLGIASCIIGYAQFAHKTVEKVLKIKKGYAILAVAIFGYPKYSYQQEIEYQKKDNVTWI